MSDRIQIALAGLSEMESARLAYNMRLLYSAIMNVDDSQQDVYALGFPLMDLIPILEQVAHDLYGYTTQATVTAERDALQDELKEHDAEDIIIEAGWKAMERELGNYKTFLQQSIEIAKQRDGALAELSELRARVERAASESAWAVCPYCGHLNRPYDQKHKADHHKECCPWRPVFAAVLEGDEK